MASQCIVGKVIETPCHLTTYVKRTEEVLLQNLDPKIREVIMWRSGLSLINMNATICLHHKYVMWKRKDTQKNKQGAAIHSGCILQLKEVNSFFFL